MSLQVGSFKAHAAWVTAAVWAAVGSHLYLATGCSEGAVRLHVMRVSALASLPDLLTQPSPHHRQAAPMVQLCSVVAAPDLCGVMALDLQAHALAGTGVRLVHFSIIVSRLFPAEKDLAMSGILGPLHHTLCWC